MIRLLRPTVLASLAAISFACSPKGAAPTPCSADKPTICTVGTAAPYCTDLTKDSSNCGACGTVCPASPTGGSSACTNGKCVATCTAGATPAACDGKCTDTSVDHDNCGACGATCGAQQQCVAATCTNVSTTQCTPGAAPVNLATDANNCGACGHVCAGGQSCSSGVCILGTSACTNTICPGTPAFCSNLSTDPSNCGNCGNKCPTPSGNAGATVCTAGACVVNCGGPTKIACNNKCTDKTTDHDNCGGCGTVCGAQQICLSGACTSNAVTHTECSPGTAVDLTSDANNCGACGNKCAAGQVCYQAACSVGSGPTSCASPTTSTTQCKNGNPPYCTNTNTDSNNCGFCGDVCQVPNNGGNTSCQNGACTPDCGGAPNSVCQNGSVLYCANTSNDVNNCGTCSHQCSSSQTCSAGSCNFVNTTVCIVGNPPTDLSSDRANCGACNNACGPTEVCKSGTCDPCPINQCSNQCTDTLHDPKNCGTCGNAVTYCENGVALAAMTVDVTPQFSVAGPNYVFASAVPTPVSVKVHSQLRVVNVTVKNAPPGSACASAPAFGTAAPMTLVGIDETSPTTWAGNVTSPGVGAIFAVQFDAYDEQYLPSRTDAAQHTASQCINATTLAAPAATTTSITAKSGTAQIGAGTSCGAGVPCKWVPLNAAPVTLTATIGLGQNIARIEFRNANVAGPIGGASVLCPSRAGTSAPPTAVPCSAAVDNTGTANLTLAAAEVGKGDLTIYACPIDLAGQYSTCTAGPAFTIGRIATAGSQPVIGKNADTSGSRTIYYTAYADPGPNTDPALWSQDYALLHSNASDLPGNPGGRIGTNKYFLDSLLATAEGSGTYAVRCSTCTQAGHGVDRIDCPTIGTAACFKQGFITPPSGDFRQIHGATSFAMLLSDSTPGTNFGGNAWYAPAPQSQTSAPAIAMGTLQQVSTINGAANATTNPQFGATTSGALVAWFLNGGNYTVQLFHPSLGAAPTALFTPAASLSAFDLVVFPTGEIVYQYVSATNRFIGAAYYDPTALGTAPKVLAPFQIGPAGNATPAKNFIRAGAGIVLGEIPTALDATKFQAIELNLVAGSPFGKPAPATPQSGPFHEGAVFSRLGAASSFAVSDDKTKAIFVNDDTNSAPGAVNPKWDLFMLDLASGAATSLYISERLLCADTTTAPTAACVPSANSPRHYPRFAHSAQVFVGGLASGTHQNVIFEEELPTVATGAPIRHARMSFANYSGGGAPVLGTIDRLTSYHSGPQVNYTTEVESPAGGAIFFLSDNDAGGSDLSMASLAPAVSSPVVSTKIVDRVFGFKIREDKARVLVERSDGTLLFGTLPGNGAPPSLRPIDDGGAAGDPIFNGSDSQSFGFTPDGDHAYDILDQKVLYSPISTEQWGYSGVLETIDLASGTFARTNWGRIAYDSPLFTAGFLSNSSTAEMLDLPSVENIVNARLGIAKASSNPTLHADTQAYSADPSANAPIFTFSSAIDGTEGLIDFAGGSNALRSDGTFLSLPSQSESAFPVQAATTSPFGGPYRPEFSQVNGAFFSGASSSLFKLWGTNARSCTGGIAPPQTGFVTISRGIRAAASVSPAQSRQTPDNREFLYSFVDSSGADTTGGYAMSLLLAGCAPPQPLLP